MVSSRTICATSVRAFRPSPFGYIGQADLLGIGEPNAAFGSDYAGFGSPSLDTRSVPGIYPFTSAGMVEVIFSQRLNSCKPKDSRQITLHPARYRIVENNS
jgi:hypothetical protein